MQLIKRILGISSPTRKWVLRQIADAGAQATPWVAAAAAREFLGRSVPLKSHEGDNGKRAA